jgi:prepilin peptidase CpaA
MEARVHGFDGNNLREDRLMEIVLMAMVAAAAVTDLRTRRIPNWIPVSGAVIGVVFGGLPSLAGAALGFGIFMILYVAGGMGAGDVKLFSAVGALVGPQALIVVFVFTGLIGGLAAIALSLSRGQLRETLANASALAAGVRPVATPQSLRLPYGAVIAAGVLIRELCVIRGWL